MQSPGQVVQASREAVAADVDWNVVLSQGGSLAAFAFACAWLGTRGFRPINALTHFEPSGMAAHEKPSSSDRFRRRLRSTRQ